MEKKTIKIICIIPTLPNEIKMDTLQSIFNQTIPVTATVILTEKITEKMNFPAKISRVLNNMIEFIRIDQFDYILRIDADVILPKDFIEKNIQAGFNAMGYGYAQLIHVKSFLKCMDGKFNPEHDDGYIIEKFKFCGIPASWEYRRDPILKRDMGKHHGSTWFFTQGELKYKYGWEPGSLAIYVIKHFCIYTIFEIIGFFNALIRRKKRFDVSINILNKQLDKYRIF